MSEKVLWIELCVALLVIALPPAVSAIRGRFEGPGEPMTLESEVYGLLYSAGEVALVLYLL